MHIRHTTSHSLSTCVLQIANRFFTLSNLCKPEEWSLYFDDVIVSGESDAHEKKCHHTEGKTKMCTDLPIRDRSKQVIERRSWVEHLPRYHTIPHVYARSPLIVPKHHPSESLRWSCPRRCRPRLGQLQPCGLVGSRRHEAGRCGGRSPRACGAPALGWPIMNASAMTQAMQSEGANKGKTRN